VRKLLIANRGEIAVRVVRTARAMGIATVAVCSEADRDSLVARSADEFLVIGPPPARASYLNQDAILGAARSTGADAVHPGYGFLSENAEFAGRVTAAGLTWVGPDPAAIRLMGDKVAALRAARDAGVPVLAGSGSPLPADPDAALDVARAVGFPVMIKAAAGGGGRGIRVVRAAGEFGAALDRARSEASSGFGDDTVYLERFVERARHVEVQVLGDGERFVHLGDRDCTMQRRSQKVLEEAPAPQLPPAARARMRDSSVELARACRYTGVGTVEFLYDPVREEAAFIEMNTRLQVEHPVTEMITGLDLVEWQLRIADGEPLYLTQTDVRLTGHAIECRINAEDPANGFFPSPGTITRLAWPEGEGIRADTGFDEGSVVTPFYDSLVAKLIVHAADRPAAIRRMRAALDRLVVAGISTTIPLHRALLATPELASVRHSTTFIEDTAELLEVQT
jgi:acetyl-CoA carboxylase biotin carboxylase subunit